MSSVHITPVLFLCGVQYDFQYQKHTRKSAVLQHTRSCYSMKAGHQHTENKDSYMELWVPKSCSFIINVLQCNKFQLISIVQHKYRHTCTYLTFIYQEQKSVDIHTHSGIVNLHDYHWSKKDIKWSQLNTSSALLYIAEFASIVYWGE